MAEIVINDIDPIVFYTAAGGETEHTFPFPIFDEGDLVVLEINTTGIVSTIAVGVDYTVSGVGVANGGTVTYDTGVYPSGLTNGYRYAIYRDLAVARGTDFLTGGDFKASTVNRELDKIIMMIQQQELELKRSLGLQKADAEDELKFKVETAANRASKALAFNSSGDEVEAVSLTSISADLDSLFSSIASGDVIQHNGTNWVNITNAQLKTALGIKFNNYAGTTAPTVNDDSGDGYEVGSKWIDTTAENVYHCVDATAGAAVWVLGDLQASDLGSAATATLIDDDTFATATSSNTPSAESVKVLHSQIPLSSKSTAYTLVAADAGGGILHPSADTTARTFTVPANSSVAYPVNTVITIINQNGAGEVTIDITTDTMRLAGAGTTGSRTLAANGIAVLTKLATTEWIISGVGLT